MFIDIRQRADTKHNVQFVLIYRNERHFTFHSNIAFNAQLKTGADKEITNTVRRYIYLFHRCARFSKEK